MLALLAMAGAALSACSPTAEPSPTPTAAFASEEEAFAAAEETYRAYNDAGNQGDDASEFLTGEALDSHISTQNYLRENELSLDGASEIVSFEGTNALLDPIAKIDVQVCLDVTGSRVIDASGQDVTPQGRENRWLLDITMSGTASILTISTSDVVEGETC